jgi:hypothetical protein
MATVQASDVSAHNVFQFFITERYILEYEATFNVSRPRRENKMPMTAELFERHHKHRHVVA